MDHILLQTKYGRNDAAASAPVDSRSSSKEYKKAAPVRAELRAAAAWAK
jgi:hypothetical protein